MASACIAAALASVAVLAAHPYTARDAPAPQASRSQTPPPGWSDTMRKGLDLTLEGKDSAALALYEAWVARHPGFPKGHMMLGGAHESIARNLFASSAAGARAARTKHFEAAAIRSRAAAPIRAILEKYRYRIEMAASPSPAAPASCNGVPAGGSASTFSVVSRPLDGFQGRTFRIAADGTLTDSR
jgi:hypothetical protein